MLFKIENLTYEVEGRSILKNRSLDIDTGKHLLLLGPSGCGKTTLMNLMAGLLRPSSGDVVFEDINYASLSETERDTLRAENFGFVFQKLHLMGHLSVEQNIALAQHKPDRGHVQFLMEDLGVSKKAKQKARDLSVGEAQRVAIARAVANNPKVIFADEPTSALDDENAGRVMDLIFDQAQKTRASVITATHDARIKSRFETTLEIAA